jgi:7-cyano-7-deazaguanine synthase
VSGAALLLSGGIDSAALACWKGAAIAFTIDYGQASAAGEERAAIQIARDLQIPHEVLRVNCGDLGSGDLALKPPHQSAPASEWWPFRNQFLITVAAMRAIAAGVNRLLVGSVKSDSFHVDGKAEFYKQIDSLMAMQEGGLRIETPAINMTSVELARISGITGPLLGWTHSCHKAEFACGYCRGCAKHREVMTSLGYADNQIART